MIHYSLLYRDPDHRPVPCWFCGCQVKNEALRDFVTSHMPVYASNGEYLLQRDFKADKVPMDPMFAVMGAVWMALQEAKDSSWPPSAMPSKSVLKSAILK